MKIAIFGATGKTGRLVVERALADGHEVRALVRDRSKLEAQPDRQEVIQGDATERQSIDSTVSGCEAVVSTLGSGHGTLTAFGKHIVPAMQTQGITRIVSLVGAGVSEAGDPASLGRSFMLTLMNLVARHVLQDAVEHANILKQSDLDWTLVRPPRLVDGPATGRIEHGEHLRLGPSASVTRSDLAAFIVGLATSEEYGRKSPMVITAS